jgi:hypothetical protein
VHRRFVAAFAALALLVLTVSAAGAQGAVVTTETFIRAQETFPVVDHCKEGTGTVTETFNGVAHATVYPDGSILIVFTITGTFDFVPDDPALPTYAGRETFHYNYRTTVPNGTFTWIKRINAIGSDGSTLLFNQVGRGTVDANGNITSWTLDRPNCR